jgi:hypothetical protein
MNTELVEYVKDRHGNRVGVVVAIKHPELGFCVGWSKCALNRGDTFDKKKALLIARGRANNGSTALVPFAVEPVIEHMLDRARRYFKCK